MTRARGITEQAADAAIDTACRVLRPPAIRARFAEAADKAEHDQLTYRGFLAELFMAECEDRDHRRAERQLRAAGFPRPKWLSDFDFDANPAISPALVIEMDFADADSVREALALFEAKKVLEVRSVVPSSVRILPSHAEAAET